MQSKILVIVPTFNEAKNISILIKKLFALGQNLSILVVDDNSPDGTAQIVKRLKNDQEKLSLIVRKEKMGLAGAYKQGFDFAVLHGYDLVIQMDADLSHDPNTITDMIKLLEFNDMVIGSRYIRGGGVLNWPVGRKLLSSFANIWAKFMLGLKIKDLTSGFKCIKTELLKKIDYSSIPSQGYAFQIEMAFRMVRKGFKVIEYPIIFKGRMFEQSKLSRNIIKEAIRRIFELRRYKFRKS
jgi:dolichol-phosphate mannosyltransferase